MQGGEIVDVLLLTRINDHQWYMVGKLTYGEYRELVGCLWASESGDREFVMNGGENPLRKILPKVYTYRYNKKSEYYYENSLKPGHAFKRVKPHEEHTLMDKPFYFISFCG